MHCNGTPDPTNECQGHGLGWCTFLCTPPACGNQLRLTGLAWVNKVL